MNPPAGDENMTLIGRAAWPFACRTIGTGCFSLYNCMRQKENRVMHMKLAIRISVTLLFLLSHPWAMAADDGLGEDMVNPGYEEKPGWFKASFLDIGEDLADATASGRQLVLYFYQDGCPYCAKLLRENFADREIATYTREHFDVVPINIWGDREVTDLRGNSLTEKTFAAALRVQYTPTLIFVNDKGQAALRLNGYYPPHKFLLALHYVAEGHPGKVSFTDYLAANDAGKAASGQIQPIEGALKPPLRLKDTQSASGKPLLVLFEQAVCSACDELHTDVLTRPGVRESLKAFDVAQLDIASTAKVQTPDGKELPARAWARQLGVQFTPSLVFFDPAGKEVFRTEAYLKTFHLQGAMDYVSSGAYKTQPNFQRYLQQRTDELHAKGIEVDLME